MVLENVAGTGRQAEQANSPQTDSSPNNSLSSFAGGQDQDQFMKILLEQLKNQNPMNPKKGGEFVSQMARLSQVEQMSSMQSSLESMQQSTQAQQYLSVLGKDVKVTKNNGQEVTGTVGSVKFQGSNTLVKIGSQDVSTESIASIGVTSSEGDDSGS